MSGMVTKAVIKRWVKPEVYPLVVFISGCVSLASFMCVRKLSIDPEVRIDKDNRMMGLPQNYNEGTQYFDHPLRRFVSTRKTQMMPDLNEYLTNKWFKSTNPADIARSSKKSSEEPSS